MLCTVKILQFNISTDKLHILKFHDEVQLVSLVSVTSQSAVEEETAVLFSDPVNKYTNGNVS